MLYFCSRLAVRFSKCLQPFDVLCTNSIERDLNCFVCDAPPMSCKLEIELLYLCAEAQGVLGTKLELLCCSRYRATYDSIQTGSPCEV